MELEDSRHPDPPSEALGVSLTRADTDMARLRRRMEMPSDVGRYVLLMLGSIIAAAAAGLLVTHPSLTGEGLLAFGVVLVLLGLAQHVLLKRDRAHWPDQAFLWADGLELVLHNGEIRALSWNDPKLAFDIYLRPLRGFPNDEITLVWRSDAKIPPCQLSLEGFDRIRAAAVEHGLEFSEFRGDNRKHGMRAYEIRAPAPVTKPSGLTTGKSPSPP